MSEYTMMSLFSGSGGFELAATMCGIRPVAASEVEPYPIAVTRSRFPGMKHLGDISKINGAEVEPVDVITFGSPCQDLSVAGKRAGLKHEANGDEETTRSGLFMEAVRIIKEMREATNGKYPSFALWENVPGAFSSNKGEDFRVVLEELIKIVEPSATVPAPDKNGWPYADCYLGTGWSLAYRVFDAQFWGVPQRRRRIHLVLDLRGERAGKVLFEREGLRGYFAESGTPWQGTAGDAENCVGAADREGVPYTLEPGIAAREGGHIYEGVSGTLRANAGDNQMAVAYAEDFVLDDQGGSCINVRTDGKSPTLRAEMHGNVPCVMKPVAYSFDSLASNSMKSSNPHSGCRQVEVAKTLDTTDPNPSKNQGGIAIVEQRLMDAYQHHGWRENGVSGTLTAGQNDTVRGDTPLVVEQYLFENHSQDTRYKEPLEVCPMLPAQLGTGGNNTPFVVEGTAVPIHDQATRYSGKRGDKSDGKGNGLGVGEPGDPMNTLTSGDRHAVMYALEGNGARPSHLGDGYSETDVMYTLNTIERHGVAYGVQTYQKVTGPLMANSHPGSYTGQDAFSDMLVAGPEKPIAIDRAYFNQGQNALYDPALYEDGTNPTLVARGPNAVCVRYIVRRLTPTECARLQGFADRWGDITPKSDFSDEEYSFWLEVRNTHARINGKAEKEYTKAQMLTWYNKLLTDSSEYKMYGNGIELPVAIYCMQGIADALVAGNGGGIG